MVWLDILTSAYHGADSRLSQTCRKTAPSMSEAGIGGLMPAAFQSTAVSLLSNLVETWELAQKIGDLF